MTRIPFLSLGTLLPLLSVSAQTPNPTNLWEVPLRWKGNVLLTGKPVKLTHDEGSNSQPSFSPDGRYVVFSGLRDTTADARSDIYRIELSSGRETRVTSTAENENSPTVNNKGEYSAVRWIPATLFKEYGVWIYGADGIPKRGVLRAPDTTGYYTPLGGGKYSLTRPKSRAFTIAIFDSASGKITDIDSGVPALPAQHIPGQNALSYVRIDTSNAHNELRRFDMATNAVTSLGTTITGRTAHAWVAGRNTLLMAKGRTLYARTGSDVRAVWKKIVDFSEPGLQSANAYVVSPKGDALILVSSLKPSLATALRDSLEGGASANALAEAVLAWRDTGRLSNLDVTEGSIRALSNERLQKKFVEDGVVLAQLATKMWPTSSRTFAQLAAAQRASNDTSGAIWSYQTALQLNPRVTDADRRAAEQLEKSMRELGGTPKP